MAVELECTFFEWFCSGVLAALYLGLFGVNVVRAIYGLFWYLQAIGVSVARRVIVRTPGPGHASCA